jgi:hypothetical protein
VLVTGSKFRVGQDREESTQKIPPGTNNLPREGRSLQHEATKHAKAGDDAQLVGMLALPVTRTVRAEASTPSVTCSAVEAEPNPLAPGLPVMSDRIPIWNSRLQEQIRTAAADGTRTECESQDSSGRRCSSRPRFEKEKTTDGWIDSHLAG